MKREGLSRQLAKAIIFVMPNPVLHAWTVPNTMRHVDKHARAKFGIRHNTRIYSIDWVRAIEKAKQIRKERAASSRTYL